MAQNPFEHVVTEVENATPNQKPATAIDGIVQQMQQSQGQTAQQCGQQLNQIKPQLIKALQQGGSAGTQKQAAG
jgi:hypothetical protein